MKRVAAIIMSASLALGIGSSAAPAGAAVAEESTLTVNGQGAISREPDRATVGVSIVTNDDSATSATAANNRIYASLRSKTAGLGMTESDVRTTAFNVTYNPRPPGDRGPQQYPQHAERYGYVVTRNLSATLAKTQNAGAFIDAAVAAGATINGVGYGITDQRGAYSQALRAAVEDAYAQAQALASAAHQRIVGVRSIQNGGNYYPAPTPLAMARVAAAQPTELPPSPVEVRASVTIVYQLAPGG